MLKKSNVLLTFLRPAWCPICNARTHELIGSYEAVKAQGFEIVAVYPSTAEELKGYVNDLNIPFTVIADPEEELYRLYKVERSKEKYNRVGKEPKALKALQEGQELYKKHGNDYGGPQQVEEPIIPADFVLENDKIQQAYYGAFLGDHLAIKNLKNDKVNTTKARF
ncbi:MAG: redoxin domain-containing protein [Aureispira sp.]